MSGGRLARVLLISNVLVFVGGLLFRTAFYARIYIAPGEPYGLADIIEFLLSAALLALIGLSGLVALALAIRGPRADRIAAAWLAGASAGVLLLAEPLHTLAARWSF